MAMAIYLALVDKKLMHLASLSDVHAGSLADTLEPLQHADRFGVAIGVGRGLGWSRTWVEPEPDQPIRKLANLLFGEELRHALSHPPVPTWTGLGRRFLRLAGMLSEP